MMILKGRRFPSLPPTARLAAMNGRNLAPLALALVTLLLVSACEKKEASQAIPAPPTIPGVSISSNATRLSGRILLQGTPRPPQPVKMDITCGNLHATPPLETLYVVGEGGGLAEVFVHIKTGLEGKTFTAPSDIPLLDQQGCMYVPKLLVVWAGQKFN